MLDNSWLIGDNDVTDIGEDPTGSRSDTQPQDPGSDRTPVAPRQDPPMQNNEGIMALLHGESDDSATVLPHPSPMARTETVREEPSAASTHEHTDAPSHHDARTSTHNDANTSTRRDDNAYPHASISMWNHDDANTSGHDDAITSDDREPPAQDGENPWSLPADASQTVAATRTASTPTEPFDTDPWHIDTGAPSHEDTRTQTHDDTDAPSHEHTITPSHDDVNASSHHDAEASPLGQPPRTLPDSEHAPTEAPPAADGRNPWVSFDNFRTQLDPWGTADTTDGPDAEPLPPASPWDDAAADTTPTAAQTPERADGGTIWNGPDQPDTGERDTQPTMVFDAWPDDPTTADDPWNTGDPQDTHDHDAPAPNHDDALMRTHHDATSSADMLDYADEGTGEENRKPIIIALIIVTVLAFLACGGYAGYSMFRSHQQAVAEQQAEQSRKQQEFEAANAYKDAQDSARTLLDKLKGSAFKDDKTLQQSMTQLDALAGKNPQTRDVTTVNAMTEKLKAATSETQGAYDRLMADRIAKIKTRRDALIKTASGLNDVPAGDARNRMLTLADTLRKTDVTEDNQSEIAKQCDELETLIGTNRKAKEDADRKAKEEKARKEAEEAQQVQQQQEQQYTPQQPQQYTPQPQYTPQYTPAPQPQTPQRQPSGGGSTLVPDTGGGSDASDM